MSHSAGIEEFQKLYRIVGRQAEIERLLGAVKANKHVLLEGPVGIGKTALAAAVVDYLGSGNYRVDGDERYSEQKLAGWFDPPLVMEQGYSWDSFMSGPLTQAMAGDSVLFINELNRIPEGTQNVLLPAMDERVIHLPKLGPVRAGENFLIIATQNPEEFVGTSRLSEALRDRFFWIGLDYQSAGEEMQILSQQTGCEDTELLGLAVEIIRATRKHPDLRHGASIRGAIDLVDMVQGSGGAWQPAALSELAVSALYTKVALLGRAETSLPRIIKQIVAQSLNGPGEATQPGTRPKKKEPAIVSRPWP